MSTQQKILDKALEMFNERGIEYVGLREVAAALGIRVGNLTYYFPTKDDLVFELAQQLSKSNAEVVVADANMSLKGFLEMLQALYRNQVRFRCLLLSFVHVMQQNKHLAAAYKKTQVQRSSAIRLNLETLVNGGYLQVAGEEELGFLVSTLALVGRFWISEAAVSFRDLNTEEQIKYYLNLITHLLLPYTTGKGKKEAEAFRQERLGG
jgi:AcrR family transcriptional regulator